MDIRDIRNQFNLEASEYDENRRRFIPCFDDYYAGATDFAAKALDHEPKRIYDLGSGTGLLSSFWFRHFPDAEYVLVDIAGEMLELAGKRFKGLPNVRLEILDYSMELPAGKADLVISALSIHHLEHDGKKNLFRKIADSLSGSGTFVNYDQFCSEDSEMNGKIESYWIQGIKSSGISDSEYSRWLERKKLDRECSVRQECEWIRDAGFKSSECIYSSGKFAVIFSRK